MPTINKCLYIGVKHLLSYTYQGVNKWVKQEFNDKIFFYLFSHYSFFLANHPQQTQSKETER